MKKLCLLLACVMTCGFLFAQDITLTFTGQSSKNAWMRLSKVDIENVSKNWTETIVYPDTTFLFKEENHDGLSNYDMNSALLFQNVPNPFDGETDVTICITEAQKVALNVHDVNGKLVMSYHQNLTPGYHTFHLHLATPQVYMLSVNAKNHKASIKMLNLMSSGQNQISYVGCNGNLVYSTKGAKGEAKNEFAKGDDMKYTGYANVEGKELTSETVSKKLTVSEKISLLFNIELSVVTGDVTGIKYTEATLNGKVNSTMPVTQCGFCFSATNQNPALNDSLILVTLENGEMSVTLKNLEASSTYYYRAFAKTADGDVLGEVKSFTTATYGQPLLKTAPVTEIEYTSAVSGGEVIETGGDKIVSRGICYDKYPNPTCFRNPIEVLGDTGAFKAKMENLKAGTTYHVRAYVITRNGDQAYGEDISFSTKDIELPKVTTSEVTSVSIYTAICGGTLTYDGYGNVSEMGVCWSKSENPTIEGDHLATTDQTNNFVVLMNNLEATTTYYVRAYAKNEAGVAYGEQKTFTTLAKPYASVISDTVSKVTRHEAYCGGNVIADAGLVVTARGVCWATHTEPTIADEFTVDGDSLGEFTSFITGLADTTTYYVRAYATNATGTSYGEQREFRTLGMKKPNVFYLQCPFNITRYTAEVHALANYADTDEVFTDQGFVIDTLPNVTLETGMRIWARWERGSMDAKLYDLEEGKTYYINAFATNAAGTSYYSQECEFTTITCDTPKVVNYEAPKFEVNITNPSNPVTVIFKYSAYNIGGVNYLDSTGYIISTKCDPLKDTNARVVVYLTHASQSSVNGVNVRVSGFQKDTKYYFRPFAVNECAKAYGELDSLLTPGAEDAELTTDTVTNILAHSAKVYGTVVTAGKVLVTKQGFCFGKQPAQKFSNANETYNYGTSTWQSVNSVYTSNSGGQVDDNTEFNRSIINLEANTTYYVRAFIVRANRIDTIVKLDTCYGNDITFTTLPLQLPKVEALPAAGVTQTSANLSGKVTFDGGATTTRGFCYAKHDNPTIESDSVTVNGTGEGNFITTINDLTPGTKYYFRAYATNEVGTVVTDVDTFTTIEETTEFICGKSQLKDVDGHLYPTVALGTQCWMAQNLRTTKYADGTSIIEGALTNTSACFYYPDKNNKLDIYGYTYNYNAVMRGVMTGSSANPSGIQGPCPDGWHVPSKAEVVIMENAVKANFCKKEGTCGSFVKSLASPSEWITYTMKTSGGVQYQDPITTAGAPGCKPENNNESGMNLYPTDCYSGTSKSPSSDWGTYARMALTDLQKAGSSFRQVYTLTNYSTGSSYSNYNFIMMVPVRCVMDELLEEE